MKNCPLCHSKYLKYHFSTFVGGKKFNLCTCAQCGISFTSPILPALELKDHYHSYYGRRKSLADGLINLLRFLRVNKLVVSSNPPRVLDVGCGNGYLLEKFQKGGWQACGTEIAPEGHIRSKLGENIYRGELVDGGYQTGGFDVVMMWHLLEHLIDPVRYIKETQRILKDGGHYVIEVPNIASWQARLTGSYWFHLDVPRHIFHFSPASLAALLQREGFTVRKVSYIADPFYSIFGIIQSVFNKVTRRNFLFDLLNGKFADASGQQGSFADYFFTLVLIVPVSLFSLLLYTAEFLFKRGGVITVYAVKTSSRS